LSGSTSLRYADESDYAEGHLEVIRCNVILSDMLVGRQFDLHDWKGIKSYQQQVKEESRVEVGVEMLQSSYVIWNHQIQGEFRILQLSRISIS
jgi:hypothetical protein